MVQKTSVASFFPTNPLIVKEIAVGVRIAALVDTDFEFGVANIVGLTLAGVVDAELIRLALFIG